MNIAGIICIVAGVIAFFLGLFNIRMRSHFYRWRMLIGGPVAIIIGILLLTGVIGN